MEFILINGKTICMCCGPLRYFYSILFEKGCQLTELVEKHTTNQGQGPGNFHQQLSSLKPGKQIQEFVKI